jgi:hypothetical protein
MQTHDGRSRFPPCARHISSRCPSIPLNMASSCRGGFAVIFIDRVFPVRCPYLALRLRSFVPYWLLILQCRSFSRWLVCSALQNKTRPRTHPQLYLLSRSNLATVNNFSPLNSNLLSTNSIPLNIPETILQSFLLLWPDSTLQIHIYFKIGSQDLGYHNLSFSTPDVCHSQKI